MRFNPLPSTAQQTHKLRQSIQNLQIVEGPGARIGQTLRSVSRGTQSQDWSNTQVSQQRNLELGLVKHSGQLIAEPRARIGQTLWSVSRGTQSQDWSNTHVSQQRNLELGLVKHSGQLVERPRARIGQTLVSSQRDLELGLVSLRFPSYQFAAALQSSNYTGQFTFVQFSLKSF